MTFHTVSRVRLPMACSIENLEKELRELERHQDLEIAVRRQCPSRSIELVNV